jgi:hypothetical protein
VRVARSPAEIGSAHRGYIEGACSALRLGVEVLMKMARSAHRLAWVVTAVFLGVLVLPLSAASGALLPASTPLPASVAKVAASLPVPPIVQGPLPVPLPHTPPPVKPPPVVPTPPVVKVPAHAPPPVRPPAPVPPVVKVPVIPTPAPPRVPTPKVTPPEIVKRPTRKPAAPGGPSGGPAAPVAPVTPPQAPAARTAPAAAGTRGTPYGGGPRRGVAHARAAGAPTQVAATASTSPVTTAAPSHPSAAAPPPPALHPDATGLALAPAVQAANPSGGGSAPPGISLPAAAGSALLLIVLALTGVLGFGLLTADGLTPAQLRRRWRSSWIHHHPWNWHG